MAGGTIIDIPKQEVKPAARAAESEQLPVAPERTPKRRWRGRRFRFIAPIVVWCLAIAAAFGLFQRVGTRGNLPGFANAPSATLAHFEQGVVRQNHVELYTYVSRGQALVSLDDSAARLRLAGLEKDLERLAAEVAAEESRLRAANAQAIAEVDDFARRTAIDRETAHIEYLAELMADARDRILLRGSSVEHDLVRKLHDGSDATFRELNDIETDTESLRAAIDRNAEVIARKKQAFEEADRRWSRYMYRPDVTVAHEPVLTPLRLSIDVREQDLLEIVRQIDAHVLRAPFAGQVTMLGADAGDRAEPGMPLVTVSPTSTNHITAYLPERVGFLPEPGTPVLVRCVTSAGGRLREYPGSVVRLSAAITEAPLRYRRMPDSPVWGRGLVVALKDGATLVPGEAVAIRFGSLR